MRAALLALLGVGCVEGNTVLCENGLTCPASTACAITPQGTHCVALDDAAACDGLEEGAACTRPTTTAPGTCHGGACFDDLCGNGVLDASEVCDDGNGIADDDCSLDCQSTLVCGNQIVDVADGEQCDAGDPNEHDGCSSGCKSERPAWQLVGLQHPSANGRFLGRIAYDAKRRRIVLFAGNTIAGSSDDTWEYDGIRWQQMAPRLSPPPRAGHQMTYDAARERVVVFSGVGGLPDTWSWDGTTWSLEQAVTLPPARIFGAMEYDSVREKVVLFGGNSIVMAGTPVPNDTWVWDGNDWAKVSVTGASPSPRALPFMAFDSKRGVMVLFGGFDTTDNLGDTWEFDGTNWTLKATTGPSARYGMTMAFDPISGRVIIVDGSASSGAPHDAWAWDGTQWTTIPTVTGPQVSLALMTTDTARGIAVIVMGEGPVHELRSGGLVQSTTGSWVSSGPKIPPGRQAHVLTADLANRQLVMFGGNDTGLESGLARNDTWVWSGTWRQITTAGPPARFGAAGAYDPIRKHTVIFGGCDQSPSVSPLGDTWTFSGTAWTPATGGTTPGARCFAQMTFDAKRGVVVMHGGEADGVPLTDTWTWDGTWHPVSPTTLGPAVAQGAFAYDPVREVSVLFGGEGNGRSSDTWTWDGTTWTKLAPSQRPAPRAGAAMAWDRARQRLVMHGGNGVYGYSVGDTWEWDGSRWDIVTADQIGELEHLGIVPALDGAGVVVFGGNNLEENEDETITSEEMWQLRWDSGEPRERCAGNDVDGDGRMNCDDPDCAAVCLGCGDGVCDPLREQCTSCPADCGVCAATCGDMTCNSGETCAGDCP